MHAIAFTVVTVDYIVAVRDAETTSRRIVRIKYLYKLILIVQKILIYLISNKTMQIVSENLINNYLIILVSNTNDDEEKVNDFGVIIK
jgi:hypothetical protein